jgi:hypothetical protein
MKRIGLTKGFEVTVDDEDFEWASQYSWCASLSTHGIPYAKNLALGSLHRSLAKRWGWDIEGKTIDHINHDTLDCTRENLRVLTKAENGRNQKSRKNSNHPDYVGVCFRKHVGRWMARIRVRGDVKFLGYFDDVEDAALAYDRAVLYYFGETGVLNFPDRVGEHDLSCEPVSNVNKIKKTNKTGYRGVHIADNKYCATISWGGRANQKKKSLGAYSTPEEAALAYDAGFLWLNGHNEQLLNFPEVTPPEDLILSVGRRLGKV